MFSLLNISIVIFQFDHHRVCFLRLLSTICSSFTDRGCRASSHFNATYITFLLFPIYINRILASHFPYTRIFKANESSPTLLPPLPLSWT